jgi:hypothetical protein
LATKKDVTVILAAGVKNFKQNGFNLYLFWGSLCDSFLDTKRDDHNSTTDFLPGAMSQRAIK